MVSSKCSSLNLLQRICFIVFMFVSANDSLFAFGPLKPSDGFEINFAIQSPYGVQLNNNTYLYWEDVVSNNRLKEIRNFNKIEHLIDSIAIEQFGDIWQVETIHSAQTVTEPAYLSEILKGLSAKLHGIVKSKEVALNQDSKLEWIKHGYSVLFTMKAFYETAWDAVWQASSNACFEVVSLEERRATKNAIWNALEQAAWINARDAAWNAGWDAAQDASWFEALTSARNTTWAAAWDGAWSSAISAAMVEIQRLGLNDIPDLSKTAYRVAEKVAMIYFLKHADYIINEAYHASLSAMSQEPKSNIFESEEVWRRFKDEKLGDSLLAENIAQFLNPWLCELDRIAQEIFSM